MVIGRVNALNFNYNKTIITKNKESDVSNPIDKTQKKENISSTPFLRAYFLGGQALSFGGFACSTGDFAVKQLDDVPCCCCGDRMIRGQQMPNVIQSFATLKGNALADK